MEPEHKAPPGHVTDYRITFAPTQPANGFAMEDFWVWDPSVVRDDNGTYHLFASRWPRTGPFHPNWLTHSEVVRVLDSGWRGRLYFEIDFPTTVRVDAVTFHEDPNHPESWMREVELEYFDDSTESWLPPGTFFSNSAVHSHRLKTPVVSNKFRLKAPEVPSSGAWPMGNVRLGEIVLHGEEVALSGGRN